MSPPSHPTHARAPILHPSGKTTLVNYILTARHGCRCAVLLNELADSADIERALVKEPEVRAGVSQPPTPPPTTHHHPRPPARQGAEAAPLAEWRELENGCICCSAKNDMVKALEALLQQRAKFDHILIETTGLANPGPVAGASVLCCVGGWVWGGERGSPAR